MPDTCRRKRHDMGMVYPKLPLGIQQGRIPRFGNKRRAGSVELSLSGRSIHVHPKGQSHPNGSAESLVCWMEASNMLMNMLLNTWIFICPASDIFLLHTPMAGGEQHRTFGSPSFTPSSSYPRHHCRTIPSHHAMPA